MGVGSGISFHGLLSCLSLVFSFFLSCSARDNITSSHPIRDGETLISANHTFELGFFTPGNSRNRYVGIWYKNIPDRKFVWVANPANPVADASGLLTIGEDGNLVLLDGSQTVIWSTSASHSSKENDTVAVLSDMGDLVLKELHSESSNILWESFDHPCNYLLQNMKITVNLKTQEKIFMKSWRSEGDPSPGNFTFGLDRQRPVQAFLWNGSVPYWRSGQWDGRLFTGVPKMANESSYFNRPTIVTDYQSQMLYFMFTLYESSSVSVFEVGYSGVLSKMDWDDRKREWVTSWSVPAHECDVYGKCGAFGSCNRLESRICKCLKGFRPKYEEKWREGDWSGGCVRITELNCSSSSSITSTVNSSSRQGEERDGFMKMERVKLPDSGDWLGALDGEECERVCLKNCSCVAYAVVNGIGCLNWGGGLTDIQEFASGGAEIFIRLASSELGRKKKQTPVISIILLTLLGAIILASFTCTCRWIVTKQRGRKRNFQEPYNVSATTDSSNGSPKATAISDSVIHEEVPELLIFDLSKIAIATNNFNDANKLGEGGFGPVYKGKLSNGQEIAVKRLSKSSGQGLEEFKNEVIFISKLQHRNLVRLLGCCIEQDEKLVLYEYMPNRSLDSLLFDPIKRAHLDWAKRFNIIEGIARGLLYLHRDSRLRIIHRDLKASNILLDEDMNAKISDFGMAWSTGDNQMLPKTDKIVGTFAYMAPEYLREGTFSEKSDVFSFGVLLLEIVSGKRNGIFHHQNRSMSLLTYAWKLWNEDRISDFIDPSLMAYSFSPLEVMRCIHVALLCVQEVALSRPTMSAIILMIGSGVISLPSPLRPGFTSDPVSAEQSHSSFLRNVCSVNDVSVTTMEAR